MATATTLLPSRAKGKDTRFFARISTADKLLFKKAAVMTGQSTATFVITQAREAAILLVESPRVIRLDAAESRRLMDALTAPPKSPTPAFKKALKAYRETVISEVNPRSPRVRKS
jgi:uncharacterized protein (DUF1778 family)